MKKQGMKFYVSQSTICRKKDLVNQSWNAKGEIVSFRRRLCSWFL
jgi:hypothetical protein